MTQPSIKSKLGNLARKTHTTHIISQIIAFSIKYPRHLFKWLLVNKEHKYSLMQQIEYEANAKKSSYINKSIRDSVVGSFEKQNSWKDYDKYLMKYINKNYKNKIALDFGTGPGRNIVKYNKKFKRIDGVDISAENINNANKYLASQGIYNSKLY